MDICVTVFVTLLQNVLILFHFFLIIKGIIAKFRLIPAVEVTEAFQGAVLFYPGADVSKASFKLGCLT